MQSVYSYFNNEDLLSIFNSENISNVSFLDSNNNLVAFLPAISDSLRTYTIVGGTLEKVFFSPCFYSDQRLDSGALFSEYKNSSKENLLFRAIKKHIKTHFLYNKLYRCYIGPGAYNDWLNRKHIYSILLDYKMARVSSERFYQIYDEAIKSGFSILPNYVRLRDLNSFAPHFTSFVILQKSSHISRTILRKSFVRYEYDSECIFVEKSEKTGEYIFILDKRLCCEKYADLLQFFMHIEQFA